MHKGVIKFLCIEHIYAYGKKYRKALCIGWAWSWEEVKGRSEGSREQERVRLDGRVRGRGEGDGKVWRLVGEIETKANPSALS